MRNIWLQQGNEYRIGPDSMHVRDMLPVGVFHIAEDPRTDELSLVYQSDSFTLPEKIYGMETDFIDHVIKTYKATERNLGVMLTGYQGTGKTLTGKILANKLHLPVIVVDHPYRKLTDFLNAIPHECIIFFDEFEKVYNKEETTTLLSCIDGAKTNDVQKVFILTTNSLDIDSNFFSRPSRIRYKKEFYSIPKSVIEAYCKDHLQNQEALNVILTYCAVIEIMTMDILASLVDEMNIHPDMTPKDLRLIFNAQLASYNVVYSYIGFYLTSEYNATNVRQSLNFEELNKLMQEMRQMHKTVLKSGKDPYECDEIKDMIRQKIKYHHGDIYNHVYCIYDRGACIDDDITAGAAGEFIKLQGDGLIIEPYNPVTQTIFTYNYKANMVNIFYIKSNLSEGEMQLISQ